MGYDYSIEDEIDDLEDRASKYRGVFIHRMIVIENYMEAIITLHFLKSENMDLRIEFTHAILNKEPFGFKFKYSVVIFIIKDHYPNILIQNPTFARDLEDYIDKRNVFAHQKFYAFDNHINKNGDSFFYTKYTTEKNKLKTKQIEINKKEIAKNIKDINGFEEILKNLCIIMDTRVKKGA